MWEAFEVIRKRRILALAHLAFIAAILVAWLLTPRPEITLGQFLDGVALVFVVTLSLTVVYVGDRFLKIHGVLHEVKDEIRKSRLVLGEIGCLSDTGRVRRLDEDSVLVVKAFSTYGENPKERVLLTVADGMGGHNKGEVASYLGVAAVAKEIVPQLLFKDEASKFVDILSASMKNANEQILKNASEHKECEGMGTTMTSAIIEGNRIFISHVGDTRAYAISEEKLAQLTKDHSYVQELVDRGEITPEQARHHPQKNVITRVVGYHEDMEVDTYEYGLGETDRILLCCDGLVSHVENQEIADIVLNSFTTSKACRDLVRVANDRGGTDNISVILTPPISKLRPEPRSV
jgi:protein phosphatase